MLGDATRHELTRKVWIRCIQCSLNSSSLKQCVSLTLSRYENGRDSDLKFCVKLLKSPSEKLEMLGTVYGASTVGKSNVFNWHKRFREG
jgi:hypothetical protein